MPVLMHPHRDTWRDATMIELRGERVMSPEIVLALCLPLAAWVMAVCLDEDPE